MARHLSPEDQDRSRYTQELSDVSDGDTTSEEWADPEAPPPPLQLPAGGADRKKQLSAEKLILIGIQLQLEQLQKLCHIAGKNKADFFKTADHSGRERYERNQMRVCVTDPKPLSEAMVEQANLIRQIQGRNGFEYVNTGGEIKIRDKERPRFLISPWGPLFQYIQRDGPIIPGVSGRPMSRQRS